jgi:hypothetical protein
MEWDLTAADHWMPFLSAEAKSRFGPAECWCIHALACSLTCIVLYHCLLDCVPPDGDPPFLVSSLAGPTIDSGIRLHKKLASAIQVSSSTPPHHQRYLHPHHVRRSIAGLSCSFPRPSTIARCAIYCRPGSRPQSSATGALKHE